MKPIIAQNKEHLQKLIEQEIKLHGSHCNLNHIDTSHITDMSELFKKSMFNGNINQWNVSNVKNMKGMFFSSKFNQNISEWDVSSVESMNAMFFGSHLNQDISKWNVSKVKDMRYMFCWSLFNKDIGQWDIRNVEEMGDIFKKSNVENMPYWSKYLHQEDRISAYEKYHLHKKLNAELPNNHVLQHKAKI